MMAAGLEYRDESVSDQPDDQFVRGLIFGTEAVSAAASRNNWSAFVEFSVPLTESLELSLAGRYDDYSDFGDTTNPKVALRWAPTEQIAFRASWGQGFRAPSLAQIGLGPSQESEFFTGHLRLRRQSGVLPADPSDPNTDFLIHLLRQSELADRRRRKTSMSARSGSRRRRSTCRSITGTSPRITRSTRCRASSSTRRSATTRRARFACAATPLAGDTLGPLSFIRSGFVNISSQKAQGVDLAAYWNMGLGAGSLTLGLDWSHLLEVQEDAC